MAFLPFSPMSPVVHAGGLQAGACAAARAALDATARVLCSTNKRPFEIGIALHHGTAAYGNVGSGERLDFTVVGRDVNFTDRIGRLEQAAWSEPLLDQSGLCPNAWAFRCAALGRHKVPSFDEGIDVIRAGRCTG
jgi:adenylate cyclase